MPLTAATEVARRVLTEAAAATAVVIGTASAVQAPPAFTIDRPFLFFIRDDSGAVLFSGQVVDPSM